MGIVVKLFVTVLKFTLFNIYFLLFAIPLILIKIYKERTTGKLLIQKRCDGKTFIITGANIGVGYETALEIAQRGGRVILACKNVGSAYLARTRLIKEAKHDDIAVYGLDLSSLWSVRNFAKEILEKEKRIDVLIFNAGIGLIKHTKSMDNIQLSWQINCISSFLLSNLLLDLMKKTSKSRIIFISSVFHHFNWLNIEEINSEKSYNAFTTYCNTKFATLLMANFMAKKLENTGITVNTVNPGLVNGPILRRIKNSMIQSLAHFILDNYGKTEEMGAATTLTVALDPQLESTTGSYFTDCKESKCVSSKAKNLELATELWNKFTKLLELKDDEKNKIFYE